MLAVAAGNLLMLEPERARCSLSRGDLEPSRALLVGDLLLRCAGKLLLPGLLASRMRAAAMPLARLCSASAALPAVSDRGDPMRGLRGARPSTSRVSMVGAPLASANMGLLWLAGRWPMDVLCLQAAALPLLCAGGCNVLLLLLILL